MPRKRRLYGRGDVESFETANKNLKLITALMSAKPSIQKPGQIIHIGLVQKGYGRRHRRFRGGARGFPLDRNGEFIRAF